MGETRTENGLFTFNPTSLLFEFCTSSSISISRMRTIITRTRTIITKTGTSGSINVNDSTSYASFAPFNLAPLHSPPRKSRTFVPPSLGLGRASTRIRFTIQLTEKKIRRI